MANLRFVLLLLGVMLCFNSWREFSLYSTGTSEPETVQLEALGSNEDISNIHLTVTDFIFADEYVFEEEEDTGKVTRAWIPLLLEGDMQELKQPKYPVVARVSGLKGNEQKLQSVFQRHQLTGVVVSNIAGLKSDEKQLMSTIVPGSDLSKAVIFDVDRSFPTAGSIAGFFFGGLALVGVFVWWQFFSGR
ncbi:hypothetical protein [Bremerella cremea]|uniref:hypothetical protein n=1 Tax=Bremerella cremea TaxID=1031537 RepID=UPI0031EB5C80